jgi:hypothetical protein
VGILLDRDAGFAGEHAGESVNRNSVRKYASRNKLLLPKYVRKVAWRLMIKVMPREVAKEIPAEVLKELVEELTQALGITQEEYERITEYDLSEDIVGESAPQRAP